MATWTAAAGDTRLSGAVARRGPARLLAAAAATLLTGAALAAGPAKAPAPPREPPPELPAETLGVATLAEATRERVYVADVAINHIVDGRLRVFDARAGRLLGMINTGYAGNMALSPSSDEIYVATTYLSRGGRGERTDVVEVWDSTTLAFKHEIVLPPKRAQTLNYRGLVRTTADGRFLLVQNATPATSITVVDLGARRVAGEVPTPGCWGTLPSATTPGRFAMLCGDGKVATVSLDAQGQVADRQLSEKLFDPDTDPWFHTSEARGDSHWFVSFKGTLQELDVSGPVARLKTSRAIVSPAPAAEAWRPGGYQVLALHPGGRWAVVAMHPKGREGSHKTPARQLWVVDLETGRVVARRKGENSVSLTFNRTGTRLHALDGVAGALRVWAWGDNGSLRLLSMVKPAGEAAVQLEAHD